jgi:hypothetical protein
MNSSQTPTHPRPRARRPSCIRVFQANVGKSGPSHDIALALAHRSGFHIIALQEPWTMAREDASYTKTHIAYHTYSPVHRWHDNGSRPRVITYIRRDLPLTVAQTQVFRSRDVLSLQVGPYTIANIYRQPDLDNMLDQLLQWQPPPLTLIVGDFNASHPSWATRTQVHGGRGRIATWIEDCDLEVTNPETGTRGDRTIDLAITNIPLTQTTVKVHVSTSSDHNILATTLQTPHLSPASDRRTINLRPEQLKQVAATVAAIPPGLPRAMTSNRQLDKAAQAVTDAISDAVRQVTRPRYPQAKAELWWNESCTEAHALYKAARRVPDLTYQATFRKDLRRTVRPAKRDFRQRTLDECKRPQDVYRICRWASGFSQFDPPPIEHDGYTYTTELERAEALRTAVLNKYSGQDNAQHPWRNPLSPPHQVNLPLTVTRADTYEALLRVSSTSPGADLITVAVLKACWKHIGDYITALFAACLTLGHHPAPFKHAEVIIIPKPNKRDLTAPGSWRPISLLSCIGKGLERLVARRIAHAAVIQQVTHPNQAGALPKRSATDLAATLTDLADEALNKGLAVTVVTQDVEGAFNAIQRNRMTRRLLEQGWPE